MSSVVLWPVVLSLICGLFVQWFALKSSQRRKMERLQAEHHKMLIDLRGDLEAVTHRMKQSQRERDQALAASARVEATVRRSDAAAAAMSVRRALELELDNEAQPFIAPPPGDGFADTQVMAHESTPSALLIQ